MELKLCLCVKNDRTGTMYTRVSLTEAELHEWAQRYVDDTYENTELVSVEVESVIP